MLFPVHQCARLLISSQTRYEVSLLFEMVSSSFHVVGVECEQEGAEHAALGGSDVQQLEWRRCDDQSELSGCDSQVLSAKSASSRIYPILDLFDLEAFFLFFVFSIEVF